MTSWNPELVKQVITRTTSLVEFIERRDGPDAGVTMPVSDVVILRDEANAATVLRNRCAILKHMLEGMRHRVPPDVRLCIDAALENE